jgi:SAM-dependent methyltransferase
MVTSDVSARGRELLSEQFDVVVDVPIIHSPYVKINGIFDTKYGSWIADSYTKWNCLGFDQYKRVAFFDADCLIKADITETLMNPEHLNRPAGVFSNSWSTTVMSLTPEKIDTQKTPMVDEYHVHIGLNGRTVQTIPRLCLRRALDTDRTEEDVWTGMRFVCAGSSIFFQPFPQGADVFRHHLELLTRPNPRCGGSGPDDQSIVRFLLEYHPVHSHYDWQFLHAGWCFIPWKESLLQSQGLSLSDGIIQHYFNLKKPWESERKEWPDLEDWWTVYDRIVQKCSIGRKPSLFHNLLHSGSSQYRSDLQDVIGSQLRRYPKLRDQLWTRLLELVPHQCPESVVDPISFDENVYTRLRSFYHDHLLTQTTASAQTKAKEALEVGASEGRASYRVQQIKQYIQNDKDIQYRVLDIGCGNGTITRVLAQDLKLRRENCVGIDIMDIHPQTDTYTYTRVSENEILPFSDHSFQMITCLMSLHHMKDADLKLAELTRVCSLGGRLILREHDAPEEETVFHHVLDVMHGLYCRVWPTVPEAETFHSGYYARYRSRLEWRLWIERTGCWKWVNGTSGYDGKNVGRFYYDVWERIGSSTETDKQTGVV